MSTFASLQARLRGPVCSIPTTFTDTGQINEDGVRRIIDIAIAGGSQVVMLTWFDSLYPLLSDDEVLALTRLVVKHVAGRAIVIAADRSWWTGQAADYARFARDQGADLVMVKPPQLGKTSPERLAEHFATVADVLPVMLVGHIPFETLAALKSHPAIVAFKDDVLGQYGFQVARQYSKQWVYITSGHMWEHAALWPYGAAGWLSNFIIFAPQIDQTYWAALKQGNFGKVKDVILRYDEPWWDLANVFPGGADALWHATLEVFGIAPRWRRSPYGAASEVELDRLRDFYRQLELLR